MIVNFYRKYHFSFKINLFIEKLNDIPNSLPLYHRSFINIKKRMRRNTIHNEINCSLQIHINKTKFYSNSNNNLLES
jgi:hypothetical protein